MQHSDFRLGQTFFCGEKRWRCTDIGTRVIVAISLEPHVQVKVNIDPNDRSRRTEIRSLSDDPDSQNGPPYGIAETVFDENDMPGCSTI